jgi:hypothetical protein
MDSIRANESLPAARCRLPQIFTWPCKFLGSWCLQIYSSWPHAGAAGPREHRRISSSGHGKTLARSLLNEHVDPAIRLEGDSELAAAEISFVSSLNMISGANCYHAARRARDHPYLACQLSDCGIWLAYRGVNPCGLVVRQGDRELRTQWLC